MRCDTVYGEARLATLIGLVVNLVLGIVKAVAGIVAHSFALLADAVNSLGDAVASVAVYYALRVAARPPDDEHPYGHSRAEAIAASNVALVIVLSAIGVGVEAIRRWNVDHPLPPGWALWIAGGSAVVKEGIYRYKTAVGRRTGSTALLATAWDHRSDALCSLAVLVGLAVVRLGGRDWIWADSACSLVVVAAILWAGGRLFRRSAVEMMDPQADGDLVEEVRREARSVEGVFDVEKLWVRKSGLEYFVDIHIQVDPQTTVAIGHEIGHRVKDRLLERFGIVRDVLVHLEPHDEVGAP